MAALERQTQPDRRFPGCRDGCGYQDMRFEAVKINDPEKIAVQLVLPLEAPELAKIF